MKKVRRVELIAGEAFQLPTDAEQVAVEMFHRRKGGSAYLTVCVIKYKSETEPRS